MEIAGIYSFNNSQEYIKAHYPPLLSEIEDIIHAVNAEKCKVKKSKEKTMPGKILFSPIQLNKSFTKEFQRRGWLKKKVQCEYSAEYYTEGHKKEALNKGAFREMDYIKERLGVPSS